MKTSGIRRRMSSAAVLIASLVGPLIAAAQLPPGNALGVSTGHIHLAVPSSDASRALWRDLGAVEVNEDRFTFIRFPGMFLMLNEREPSGPSAGSTAELLGFRVRDLDGWRRKLEARGAAIVSADGRRVVADLPGGVRVELRGDAASSDPIRYERVQLASTDPERLRDWYVELFGARATTHDGLPSAEVPGGRVDFAKVDAPRLPSRGRAIDHIGFEVDDVAAFGDRLKAWGLKLDLEPTLVQPIATRILFFTDPEGTYIELTQGLRRK